MIIIRQKAFAEDEQQQTSSTSKKIAKGAAIAGLTAAAAFAGAKSGMLGSRARVATNTIYGNVGNKIGSQSMVASAERGIMKGVRDKALSIGASRNNAQTAAKLAAGNVTSSWTSGNSAGIKDAVKSGMEAAKLAVPTA